MEELADFLNTEKDWIIPSLFGGVEPEVVAHNLSGTSS